MSAGGAVDALSSVLSDVMDAILEIKEAHRKVPGSDSLHVELDRLFADLGSWAQMLLAEEEASGVAPLAQVSSAATRGATTLWVGKPTDSEVRRTLGEHLERLRVHVVAARGEVSGAGPTEALATVQEGLTSHLQLLAEP